LKRKALIFLLFSLILSSAHVRAQSVGLVLSGGGATGLAHVGVLMAIEEAEIPIDYIAGTSAGALVGAMYACGYSPVEIKSYILSDKFIKMTKGATTTEQRFLLREKNDGASMLNVAFSKDSLFKKSLPTNFMTPAYLDYEMLRIFGTTGASVDKQFDSLFVPFRCVASDIREKKSVVFSEGNLNAAVRASMTYPFYVNPIRIDGKLLFDGGLYDNFPAHVLYNEFPVDYIIGSNVSYNASPPKEGDVISQVSNMLMKPTNFELPCEEGIIISPNTSISTFDFSNAQEAINSGYQSTLPMIDSILNSVNRRVSSTEMRQKRMQFLKKVKPLQIDDISTSLSQQDEDISFIRKSFIRDSIPNLLSSADFTKRYFRAYATPQVKYMYPTISRSSDSSYQLNLDIRKEKPFELSVGGHFSSRPVNTAYIGLSYFDMGKGALQLHGESYFGKFYGSTKVELNYDLPTTLPLRVSPYFLLNRWDYFRSSSTFFEDSKPSFLVQNELYYGTQLSVPLSNSERLDLDFRKFQNEDEYYQTLNFSSSDTADITLFSGESVIFSYKHSTLNRKQWASDGSFMDLSFRYVQGKEQSLAGNTQNEDYDVRKFHRWLNISIEGQHFFNLSDLFQIGIYGKSVLNSQSLFSNYTASILATTEFSPLPDSRTLFMTEYRAPQYAGGGANFIFQLTNFIDLRFDPYIFQPFKTIEQFDNGTFGYINKFQPPTIMAGASVVFHTPIGPLRVSTNYFPKQSKPFSTQVSFGYVIFNDRAIR